MLHSRQKDRVPVLIRSEGSMVVEVAESMVNEQSSPTPPRVTPVRRVKLNRAQLDSTTTYMLQNCLNSSKLTPPEQSSSRWSNISKARCRACFRSSVGYLWHSTHMNTMWVRCAFAKLISQDMRNAGCFAPVHQAEPPASVRGLLLHRASKRCMCTSSL